MLWGPLRLASALLMIAGLLLAMWASLYAVRYIVLIPTSFIPLVGKRHRHDRWTEMNSVENVKSRSDGKSETETLRGRG
jgi:di/tricarboxylate transporter